MGAEFSKLVHGATRPRVNTGQLRNVPIAWCPLPEQREIVRCIEAAFAWLDKVAAEQARAAELLPRLEQSILSKAFRGELVPQDPTDEPAAALLKRIRERSHNAAGRKRQRA
jgi:type I restriction enzyme, S subunit